MNKLNRLDEALGVDFAHTQYTAPRLQVAIAAGRGLHVTARVTRDHIPILRDGPQLHGTQVEEISAGAQPQFPTLSWLVEQNKQVGEVPLLVHVPADGHSLEPGVRESAVVRGLNENLRDSADITAVASGSRVAGLSPEDHAAANDSEGQTTQ